MSWFKKLFGSKSNDPKETAIKPAAKPAQKSEPETKPKAKAKSTKRKTLPKDFEELLKAGDLEALKAIFDKCDVNAYGGYTKQTALAFAECPDDLARWLVDNGADIMAEDRYGETPLHARAGHWKGNIDILLELGADVNHGESSSRGTPLHRVFGPVKIETAKTLIAHGANVNAVNDQDQTPLEFGLQRCHNARLQDMAPLAKLLLDEGAEVTPKMREYVTRIGENFEFHRTNFDPASVDANSAALHELYRMVDVPPVPRRVMHDGKSSIIATSEKWQDQHQELWEMLVPSNGSAATVQGEVIRISGKIADEMDRNGGVNWDADYRKMADAFWTHVQSGNALAADRLKEAETLIKDVKKQSGDTERLCEMSVEWVALNPAPVKLPKPAYKR